MCRYIVKAIEHGQLDNILFQSSTALRFQEKITCRYTRFHINMPLNLSFTHDNYTNTVNQNSSYSFRKFLGIKIQVFHILQYINKLRGHLTIAGNTADMPNLAKENSALSMNSIHNRFPSFHLLSGPNTRRFWIPSSTCYNGDAASNYY